jgi:ceramide synthetase
MEIIEQRFHLSPTNPNLVFPDEYLSIFKWLGIWLAVHFTLYNTVFKRFVMWCFPDSKLKNCYNRRQKLYTALWKLTYFGFTSMFGLYLMRTESWVLDPSQYFINWPNQDMSTAVKIYYNIQMAGYMHAFLTMPFEPKQAIRDYIALLIHHVSTLFLLWNSYTGGVYRIGVAVATLHDLSDPIMEFAKILLYLEYSKVVQIFT